MSWLILAPAVQYVCLFNTCLLQYLCLGGYVWWNCIASVTLYCLGVDLHCPSAFLVLHGMEIQYRAKSSCFWSSFNKNPQTNLLIFYVQCYIAYRLYFVYPFLTASVTDIQVIKFKYYFVILQPKWRLFYFYFSSLDCSMETRCYCQTGYVCPLRTWPNSWVRPCFTALWPAGLHRPGSRSRDMHGPSLGPLERRGSVSEDKTKQRSHECWSMC